MSSESVLVVWLDEIRWFLEDMNLTEFALVSLGKKRRRLPNFASALPWLLSVSAAKQRGLLGGFEEITTGEERTECIEHQWGAVVVDDAWSPPILGYLQPPVVAILPADTRHQGLLSSLERLRFHCGGQIYVFHAEAPPREGFRLDGSFGWSKSCKHVERCHCPRTPVSPYGAWGWRLWRSFHRQLPQVWHLHTLDQWPAVAQSVTVVVFHFVRGKAKVLKFWRDPTAGGHFTGWSVPGGSIATGKDSGLWCTARREWNEETVGYPWEMAVGDALSEERSECIEGSWVYRSGRCLLCIANLGEVLLARDQWSDEVFSNGWSPRSNATVYAPAKPDFYGKGAALPLQRPMQIEKTKENFRLLYNTKGRFMLHKVAKEEASYKLCRVKKVMRGPRGVPYAVTHDGRTIRYPDPDVKAHDTIRLNLDTGKMMDHVKFETGNMVMISGGNNIGRVGTITHEEKHPGSFEMVHVKDALGHTFNTRLENVFVIGQGSKPWISLPKGNGVKMSIIEDRVARMK